MTHDRDRTCGIIVGLAVLAFVPLQSRGAELMRRLPPVQSDEKNGLPAQIRGPVKLQSVPRAVSQSVWLQKEADPRDPISSQKMSRPVQLVNWNEEPIVPPVQIELDSVSERPAAPAANHVSVPYMRFVSQPVLGQTSNKASVSAAKQVAGQVAEPAEGEGTPPGAIQDAPPAPAQPAVKAETIEAGTPFLDEPCQVFDDCECFEECLPPCWFFQAEALPLFRSDVRTIKIVEEGTGANVRGQRPALLTTDDLDPNAAWGPRFTLGRYLNDVRNLELVYFGLHRWTSQAAFDGINGVGFSFNNIDVPFDANITSDFDGAQFISADYVSKIHNAEANLVTNNRWDLNSSTGFPWYHYVDFLAGFRYFRLHEEFDLRSTDAGETSDYLIDAVNDLVGGQVGVVAGTYHSPRVSWNLAAKAGMYANFARQSTLMRDDNNTVLFRDFTTEGREMAFVGDMNFNLAYDIRPNMALTAGYYLLYVGGLALAPEQLDFSTTPTSGSGLNQNGGAFYHGPSVGLRITY